MAALQQAHVDGMRHVVAVVAQEHALKASSAIETEQERALEDMRVASEHALSAFEAMIQAEYEVERLAVTLSEDEYVEQRELVDDLARPVLETAERVLSYAERARHTSDTIKRL
ncbi:MAG: hypothetical protein O3A46_07600 [Candidatus Poribacteria bacterium]|nr:hypothetical protein [Candidatus Poribacteria bacterium]